jgi:mono/diheme cytochrome c family protein
MELTPPLLVDAVESLQSDRNTGSGGTMRGVLKVLLGLVVILILGAAGFFVWASSVPAIAPIAVPERTSLDSAKIEAGELLVAVGDCVVCHTAEGGQDFAGGRPLPTPFGTIHSTNITPDAETGIGTWSEEAFRRAMREGLDREGNYLYPAFPYDHFTKTTDEDIGAIYAYLMSQQAHPSQAAANELPFPFNIRQLMAGWNLLFLEKGPYQPDSAHDEEWNRGAYLVESLGHCGACHTPRNALGAVKTDQPFAGGEAEFWHAPALNRTPGAPAGWTADQLANYLIDGWDEDHGVAAGPMTPVVDAVAQLPEDDVYAIAAYLLSFMGEQPADKAEKAKAFAAEREFPAVPAAPAANPADTPEARGESTFLRVCSTCHKNGGEVVPLAMSSTVAGPDPRNVIHIVMNGIKPPAGSPDKTMPAFGLTLSDEQIADLVTFVRSRFSDKPAWPDVAAHVRAARSEGGS